ncbi:MAG: TonB-dependent receptor [Acidobacteria bacterium]|nr:TonB-dependent receptor [Acidobacteriota bacterium]
MSPALAAAQAPTAVRVEVRADEAPIADADLVVNGVTYRTGADGVVLAPVQPGAVEITVVKEGFAPLTSSVTVAAGQTQRVLVDLEERPSLEEEVIVTATRTETRLEDQPMRVEVVPGEEVQEKIMMTPGDVSMLLNETNGLRVQTTSPSLGGATVRIQGLRGRYTQILADGLPLYGGQTGSIGLLQIPPMDLGQVEVIKGVASALYGMSAIGGVVNLVSRRPPAARRERELLVNGTSHGGTDVVNWLAGPLGARWGYTFVGGLHMQQRSDLDEDGWTDLPTYRRVVARPRFFWSDEAGKSLLVALGGMGEERRGGTTPGRQAPDGRRFAEDLDTTRVDGGAVWRMTTGGGRVLAARGSATAQRHTHTFGAIVEQDDHHTLFGEVTLTGAAGRHTWVAGGALQSDRYRSRQVPRFDYTHVVPGVFAQDEFRAGRHLTLSGSARVDAHSEFGAFVSPRISALVRPAGGWSLRVSTGRGYFAPTPFTEETEALGLTPVAPLGTLRAERAETFSADVTWARAPLEVTATFFHSRIHDALTAQETGRVDFPVAVVNVEGRTLTRGTELIARVHREGFDVIATHMYLWSTEPAPPAQRATGAPTPPAAWGGSVRVGDPGPGGRGRREVPLNPRHAATFDLLKQVGPARIGFEVFYTGRQALDENPFRRRGFPHVLYGGLVDWAVGGSRVYVNVENLGDVRQTREHPLVKPVRGADGRWTVDAWAPLEGRTVNAGVRWRF